MRVLFVLSKSLNSNKKEKEAWEEGRKERRGDGKRGWTGFYQVCVSINSSFCLHLSVFTQSPRCLSAKVAID